MQDNKIRDVSQGVHPEKHLLYINIFNSSLYGPLCCACGVRLLFSFIIFTPFHSTLLQPTPYLMGFLIKLFFSLLFPFFRNSNSNSHTNHRVVSCTDQTHHLYVSRNGGRTCELCVRVHTSHSICHTVGSRTCCHVVRMKCTSCTTAGSNREVFLALLITFFLVSTCNRMLESGGFVELPVMETSTPSFHMIATPSVTSLEP